MMKTASFSKYERLKQAGEFSTVLKANSCIKSGWIALHFSFGQSKTKNSPARLGVMASKRCLKTACLRNRAKRVIREWFRSSKKRLPPGVDFLVRWISPKNDFENQELREYVEDVFLRARKIIEKRS